MRQGWVELPRIAKYVSMTYFVSATSRVQIQYKTRGSDWLFSVIFRISHAKISSMRQHARLSRSGPGFNPRSGQVSWVRFLSGFFLTCKTNVRKLSAPKGPRISFGHHNHPSFIHYGRQWWPEMLTRPKTSNIHTVHSTALHWYPWLQREAIQTFKNPNNSTRRKKHKEQTE